MVKISANRIDLETKRLERAQLRNYTETLVSVTASATTTLDLSTGNIFDLTHGTNITTLTLSNVPASGTLCSITIIRTKDATGTARTITWPASFKWPQGTAPTLTQTTGAIDVIVATTKNGGTTWFATVAGQAVAAVPVQGLWAWGSDPSYNGKLGKGGVMNYSTPSQIGALLTWSQASASTYHSGAIKADGTLWMWGDNSKGSLGHGLSGGGTGRSSPVQIGALTTWSQLSLGRMCSAAIKSDGTLWTWGANSGGQLGIGSTGNAYSPVQVGALTNWAQVSAGGKSNITYGGHMVAIKTDGTLWAWGKNNVGQLGRGNTTDYSSPVQVGALTTWAQVSTDAGGYHNLAVKTDGTLWAWGKNGWGQLGDGSTTDKSSPVQVGALTTWSKVAAGGHHSLAIKMDGTLWSWGYGANGLLGRGNVTPYSSPVQVGALTTWSSINCGYQFSHGIKTDGTLWAWGRNYRGQLGLGDTANRSSPVQVGVATNWGSVSGGLHHALAVNA